MKSNIPNILSLLRMALAAILPFIVVHRSSFILIYLIAGLTDVLDGYIARKKGWESSVGALLDSLADALFFLSATFILLRCFPHIVYANWEPILLTLAIKLGSAVCSYTRFRQVAFIHTYANKILGLVLFIFFPLLMLPLPPTVIRTVCFLAILPALEELLIVLTDKQIRPNRKSIFQK